MADGEQDGPDLETLQAQIDMSMAFTQNIVSGWMKSSKAKLPSSSARNDDKELEEYMRRPARLGVGAAAPEATGVFGRETAKLRSRLAGKGKKRERDSDGEDGPARTGTTAGGGATAESDDDEDSRARAITKKARVDPFAAKDKGKKKKNKKDPAVIPAAAEAAKSARARTPPVGGGAEDVEMGEAHEAAREAVSPENDAALPAPSKRKRKKKHKANVGQDDAQPRSPPPAVHDAAASPVPEKKAVARKERPTESSPTSKSLAAPVGASLRASGAAPSQPSALSPAPAGAAVVASKASSVVPQDRPGFPLLNLSGPPPSNDGEASGSPKKKRKRKKKKKKTVAQSADGPDAADGEGEEGSEDD